MVNDGILRTVNTACPDKRAKQLIHAAEIYCGCPGDKTDLDKQLEFYLDREFDKYLKGNPIMKFRDYIDESQNKMFIALLPNQELLSISLVDSWTIERILTECKDSTFVNILKNIVLPKMGEGAILLNTNIPVKILQESGFKVNQYIVSPADALSKSNQENNKKLSKGHKL